MFGFKVIVVYCVVLLVFIIISPMSVSACDEESDVTAQSFLTLIPAEERGSVHSNKNDIVVSDEAYFSWQEFFVAGIIISESVDYVEIVLSENGSRLRVARLVNGVAWHLVMTNGGIQSGLWNAPNRELRIPFDYVVIGDYIRLTVPENTAREIQRAISATRN